MYKPERLMAFCDGVIAIAITLLVLGLEVPSVHSMTDQQLLAFLEDSLHPLWGYVVSFILVGTYWLQHYVIFHYVDKVDRTFVALNGVFLLCISFVPFPTGLQSSFRDDDLAMVIYAATQAACGASLVWIWWYATRGRRLVRDDVSDSVVKSILWRTSVTPLVSLLALLVLPISPVLSRLMFLVIPIAQFSHREQEPGG